MDVRFGTADLRRAYEAEAVGRRFWGAKVARLYIGRINLLQTCASTDDLRAFPHLRYHPLKGPRAGQYALNLDGFWRLLLIPEATKQAVTLVEVSKHYDD